MSLLDLTPNQALERTAHSARVVGVRGCLACGPPLTASVSWQQGGLRQRHVHPQGIPRLRLLCP
jgi:hypothetical protein